jgi:hypothetical protein
MSSHIELISPDPTYLQAEACSNQIKRLGNSLVVSSLALGRLLKEFRDHHYASALGYPRFGDWVEEASGLDMSERNAYDLIAVVEKSAAFGITEEQLHAVKLSKLKSIFTLPADTDPQVVKDLLEKAETEPLAKIQQSVGQIKGQSFVMVMLKLEQETYDNTFLMAVEKARRVYGNTMGLDGGAADISVSRCVEMWAAEYLAAPEEIEYDEDVAEGEFEDVLLPPVGDV